MVATAHTYRVGVRWADEPGTVGYRTYTRDLVVSAVGKPELAASADAAFRGTAARWNPEELLVAALSQCHLLSFLHCCADAGVVVTAYADEPVGRMTRDDDGGWSFAEVVLRPVVTTAPGTDPDAVDWPALHHAAHEACFIARSVAFDVRVEPAGVRGPENDESPGHRGDQGSSGVGDTGIEPVTPTVSR